jgi:hypothetical protein
VEHLELPSLVICVLTGVASGSLSFVAFPQSPLPPFLLSSPSSLTTHPFLNSPHSLPHNQPSLAALANGLLLAHRRLHLRLVPTPIHQNLSAENGEGENVERKKERARWTCREMERQKTQIIDVSL